MKKRSEVEAKSSSLAKQAYLILRERILRADYPFGTILSARQLARQFGMSLVPVAEALQRLEQDELIERRPRAGTRVKIPTPDEIRGLYVVREALESQAARLCAIQASAAERVKLRTLAAELDDLFSENNALQTDDRKKLFERHEHHVKFHTYIAEFGHCPTLLQAIERNHVLLFNFLYDVASKRTFLPRGFHSDLVDPIIRGDPEKADATMRAHVRYGLSETLLRLQPHIQNNGWRLGKNNAFGGRRRASAPSRTEGN